MSKQVCINVLHGVFFDLNNIRHCCMGFVRNGSGAGLPLFRVLNKDSVIDETFINDFFQAKKELLHKILNNIECECTDCPHGQHRLVDYDEDKFLKDGLKIKHLVLSPSFVCNTACYYCIQDHTIKPDYDFSTLIEQFISKKIVDTNDIKFVQYAGGEPTLIDNFDTIHSKLSKNAKDVLLTTSAIRYSESVEETLKTHKNYHIRVSIDSASREAYKAVKKVDQFDKVVNSINKYSAVMSDKSKMELKYIVLPENCSRAELDKLINLIIENKWQDFTLIVDMDFKNIEVPDNIMEGILYLQSQAILKLDKHFKFGDVIYERLNYYLQKLSGYGVKEINHIERIEQIDRVQYIETSKYAELGQQIDKLIPPKSIRRELTKSAYHFAKAVYKLIKKI